MSETESTDRSDRAGGAGQADKASDAASDLSDRSRDTLSGTTDTMEREAAVTPAERAASQDRMRATGQPAKDRLDAEMPEMSARAMPSPGSARSPGYQGRLGDGVQRVGDDMNGLDAIAEESAVEAAATPVRTAEERAAIARGTRAGIADATQGWVSDVVSGAVEAARTVGQAGLVGLEAATGLVPDEVAATQAQALKDKVAAAREQLAALPDLPEALAEKYRADLDLADALEAAYDAGKADLSILEESARIRARATTEIGILAAETGTMVLGGAGALTKAARGLAKMDLDLPGGAVGALSRATEVSRKLAEDMRRLAADETGAVGPGDLAPGKKIDRDWFEAIQDGLRFNAENAHRYTANEITVEYPGNPSGTARVDSVLVKSDEIAEIVSRKHTQLADVMVGTAKGYLNELATKYPVGAQVKNTPVSRAAGIQKNELSGTQILEVPVQERPVPQEILDYAKDLDITIRDIDGKEY